MMQILLIKREIEGNRKLKFEEERRKNHRFQPITNYLAPVSQPSRIEQNSQESQAPATFIAALAGLPFTLSCE